MDSGSVTLFDAVSLCRVYCGFNEAFWGGKVNKESFVSKNIDCTKNPNMILETKKQPHSLEVMAAYNNAVLTCQQNGYGAAYAAALTQFQNTSDNPGKSIKQASPLLTQSKTDNCTTKIQSAISNKKKPY